jgi:hypothetical protein
MKAPALPAPSPPPPSLPPPFVLPPSDQLAFNTVRNICLIFIKSIRSWRSGDDEDWHPELTRFIVSKIHEQFRSTGERVIEDSCEHNSVTIRSLFQEAEKIRVRNARLQLARQARETERTRARCRLEERGDRLSRWRQRVSDASPDCDPAEPIQVSLVEDEARDAHLSYSTEEDTRTRYM